MSVRKGTPETIAIMWKIGKVVGKVWCAHPCQWEKALRKLSLLLYICQLHFCMFVWDTVPPSALYWLCYVLLIWFWWLLNLDTSSDTSKRVRAKKTGSFILSHLLKLTMLTAHMTCRTEAVAILYCCFIVRWIRKTPVTVASPRLVSPLVWCPCCQATAPLLVLRWPITQKSTRWPSLDPQRSVVDCGQVLLVLACLKCVEQSWTPDMLKEVIVDR